MADIKGLPPGAVVKPIAGLPPGATVKPIASSQPQIGTTPQSMGIGNPIPTSQGVPPALRGPATMADKIKSGDASEMPGSFEGKPENVPNGVIEYGKAGPGQIASGVADAAHGNISRGLHKAISGAGVTLAPAALPAAVAAPIPMALGIAGGTAGTYGARKAANYFGATPDQADLAGDVGGIVAGGLASEAGPRIGGAMQDTAAGIMNRAVGLRKGDYARGANPGMAYLEGGNGPSLNMRSIATKAEATNADTGAKLGAAYKAASTPGSPLIPPTRVESALRPPIDKGIAIANGPGGNPANANLFQEYGDTFKPTLANASGKGGFTPEELFDVKKNIAANTNWRDQAQFNINKVRQQNTGAVGEILTDAVPETKPMNAIYQGSRILADRATERANTGSMPLTGLFKKAGYAGLASAAGFHAKPEAAFLAAPLALAADSIPVKTTVASGMFRVGRGLKAGGTLRNLFAP